ncbi:MAG: limonene-1,2-epoxide hydrolase family protein [Pseudomonadota bacterium]
MSNQSTNIAIVLDFIKSFSDKDLEKILDFVADDCLYHNIPMEPVQGKEAMRQVLAGFVGMASEIEWITHHIAETSAGAVLTERNDKFLIGDKWLDLPVMGTFEITDGKISAWRDYFDLGQFQSQMPQ